MGRRFEIACVVALAVHAPLFVALHSPPKLEARVRELDVDLDLAPDVVAAPTDEPTGMAHEAVGAARRNASPHVAGVATEQTDSARNEVEPAIEASHAPSLLVALPSASLDLPRAYAFGGVHGEATPSPGASAEAAMRSALDERDRAAGLDRSGPIASAMHAVAGGDRIAPGSSATLVATVDESGAVVAVAIARSTGDAAAWRNVADALLAAMRGKRIAVPQGAHGLRLGFAVESRVRRAGGHMTNGRTPVFVTPDDAHASRAPSIALGTPVYRCLEGCTASANLDPTDAVLNATQSDARTIVVESLPAERIP
jgi:hypothetical protein